MSPDLVPLLVYSVSPERLESEPFPFEKVQNRHFGVSFGVARWFLFKPKNPNLGKFWRNTYWKMLMYFMAIWNILQTFGIFYDQLIFCLHLVLFPVLVACTKKSLATLVSLSLTEASQALIQSFFRL
jgi:hypothetical protein